MLNMKITTKRQFRDELYAQFARIGKALSNPHRLELVELLAQGERTVEDLAGEASLPIANASQHLQVLRAAQLVDVRRDGLYAYYRLSDERVFRVWQALRDLGELQLAEVNRLVQSFLQDRSPYNRSMPQSCWNGWKRAMLWSWMCDRNWSTDLATFHRRGQFQLMNWKHVSVNCHASKKSLPIAEVPIVYLLMRQ
jgi:DNA-binding transcriptional ArsR family regulator